ncbi:MAG: hypothetical protein ACFFCI_00700 [Promethearchaeota archaeon]
MTTQQMVKIGRSKLKIIKDILEFLEKQEVAIYISDFKEIGLDNKTALEYLKLINFFAKYFTGEVKINITKVGREGEGKKRMTLVQLKKN